MEAAAATPVADRAPEWVAAGTPQPLRDSLGRLLGEDRVLSRALDLVKYAADASPYLYMPQAVVMARDAADVAKTIGHCRDAELPLTFRAGGTSLNGQAQTEGVLVDVRRHFGGIEVLDGGERVRVRPGTVLGAVNRVLAAYGRRLGPDPASTDIATVGGVIANNSGGMRCGTTADSYSTVCSLTFTLPSGETIDTAAEDAADRFRTAAPELDAGLVAIRDELRADDELAERVRQKFEIKNTTGYRLCAFLDADEPLEIFRRLLIGSEGTLGFVSEAVFETVAQPPMTTLSWVHFPGIAEATASVTELVAAGASAVELMVAPALMVASHNIPGTPESWRELPPESAALLIEFGGADEAALDAAEAAAAEVLAAHETLGPADFTREQERIELNWRVREGLHGLVGRLRPEGSALIIEDVCVRPERMAESAADIQAMLGEHEFLTGVAGHASAGNLHFMLTPDFGKPSDRERYEAFMEGLVETIVGKYDGSLKAEHGTGLNMAPYVEREWGARATELMWRVKEFADPGGVLAPGVLLSRDPGIHLRALKTTPPIEEVATNCVECGFCEPVCPSRDLTTTPRQRIVVRREMARQDEGSPVLEALKEEYEYDGLETCAADGTCMLACPLGIDTGKLVKEFRAAGHSEKAERRGVKVAQRYSAVERAARGGLRAGSALARVVGDRPIEAITGALRRVAGEDVVPGWSEALPAAAPSRLAETTRDGAAAIYMPACINRIFGLSRRANGGRLPDTGDNPPAAGLTVVEALVAASERAGMPVWIPDDVRGRCCGVPWSSKGYRDGHAEMTRMIAEAALRWTEDGGLPLILDASSCAHGLSRETSEALPDDLRERWQAVEVLDTVAWAERLLPALEVSRPATRAVIHPTCSTRHMNQVAPMRQVTEALADDVVVPLNATCCGMAGDRGLLRPELTASATKLEAEELAGVEADAWVSANRTCEIGLEQATGEPYESVIQLLERATRT
jgi:D-lactate dehydrogenase